MADETGLDIARDIYSASLDRFEELCTSHIPSIDIDKKALPSLETVKAWNSKEFASALKHDPSCKLYNVNFRQLLSLSQKVASEMGDRYLSAVEKHQASISSCIDENINSRHILPIFGNRRTASP